VLRGFGPEGMSNPDVDAMTSKGANPLDSKTATYAQAREVGRARAGRGEGPRDGAQRPRRAVNARGCAPRARFDRPAV
jgi:hypothetical protein